MFRNNHLRSRKERELLTHQSFLCYHRIIDRYPLDTIFDKKKRSRLSMQFRQDGCYPIMQLSCGILRTYTLQGIIK